MNGTDFLRVDLPIDLVESKVKDLIAGGGVRVELQLLDRLEAKGYVIAAHQIQISPQVGGEIVWLDPNFKEGAIYKKGDKLAEFEKENEVDFSFGVQGLSRFRVNAFRQRGVISLVCRAGVPVAVCGQLAGDPEAVPLLVGLGVRELSVAPARIPEVKQALASMTLDEMRALAQQRLAGA